MLARRPLPVKLEGIPMMPNRNTSITATMNIVFQRRFLVIFTTTKTGSQGARCETAPGSFYNFALLSLHGFIAAGHRNNGRTGYFQPDIVRWQAKMDIVIPQCHNGAAQSAAGSYAVTRFQFAQH